MKSANHEQEFKTKILSFVKNCNKLFKGPSVATSNELSTQATRLLCSDPESSLAQSFQEMILKNNRTNKTITSSQLPVLKIAFKERPKKLSVFLDSNLFFDSFYFRNSFEFTYLSILYTFYIKFQYVLIIQIHFGHLHVKRYKLAPTHLYR